MVFATTFLESRFRPKRTMDPAYIHIQGAREHNLKNVTLSIPRNRITVLTGVSGSGKSSLAYDTLYREGEFVFLESLSPHFRDLLGPTGRPRVDGIEGLSPCVGLHQDRVDRSPRSTVGTITEIYDLFRILFATLGSPFCPTCNRNLAPCTQGEALERILRIGKGNKATLLASIQNAPEGDPHKSLKELLHKGYTRVRVNGFLCRIEEALTWKRREIQAVEVVLDRLAVLPSKRNRIQEALERGFPLGGGSVLVLVEGKEHLFSTVLGCQACGTSFPGMEPKLFSFNSPFGSCPSCKGLGEKWQLDPASLVVDENLSLEEGALVVGMGSSYSHLLRMDEEESKKCARSGLVPLDRPWKDLSEQQRGFILFGRLDGEGRKKAPKSFQGIVPLLEEAFLSGRIGFMESLFQQKPCSACQGRRLRPEALQVKFRGYSIGEIVRLTAADAALFFENVRLKGKEKAAGEPLIQEILQKLRCLERLGLSYLTLDRRASSLSAGEARRIRLASQLGSGLSGILYVLDEPSIGLHPRDNSKLIQVLQDLRDQGNTLVVVEHDLDTIRAGDYLIELGPGAGQRGGAIVFSGTPQEMIAQGETPTGKALRGEMNPPAPSRKGKRSESWLTIRGAREHNLKNLTVSFPLGCFTAVTGVSGSGKSSLVEDILKKALLRKFHRSKEDPGEHEGIEGADQLKRVIAVDQSPLGRSTRSNPATYTGAFHHIRDLFSKLPEARMRGYGKGRFSFNVSGGRCEGCQGSGSKVIQMPYLPDVAVPCEACKGLRFNRETLEVIFKGKSIAEVLEMTVEEALKFFSSIPPLKRILKTLHDVGLAYLPLGQPSSSLSGGEVQRIKIASEMGKKAAGRTLILLDEPTTGLHPMDVQRLLHCLRRLTEKGNTVVVIEHNLEMVRSADYVIDLGPEGGEDGGEVVFSGRVEELLNCPQSHTGRALKQYLERRAWQPGGARQKGPPVQEGNDILLEGVHKNNLKNITLRIPKGVWNVITGVSGSGKSSLALDSLFAEGQRKFVESLSVSVRGFLGQMEKAPLKRAEGLTPTIGVGQGFFPPNPRSTVATSTGLYDFFRLLYSTVGRVNCPECGKRLKGWTASGAAEEIVRSQQERLLYILAPLYLPGIPRASVMEKISGFEKLRERLKREGFLRMMKIRNGESKEERLNGPVPLEGELSLYLITDRIIVDSSRSARVAESLETAFKKGRGFAAVKEAGSEEILFYSSIPACLACGIFFEEELTSHSFSFNSPAGACSRCRGTGEILRCNIQRLIPRPGRPLLLGALTRVVGSFLEKKGAYFLAMIRSAAEEKGIPLGKAWSDLGREERDFLLHGKNGRRIAFTFEQQRGNLILSRTWEREWKGLARLVEGWCEHSKSPWWSEQLHRLMEAEICPECGGSRLNRRALSVKIAAKSIAEICKMTIRNSQAFFSTLSFEGAEESIARPILREILGRLRFLVQAGLYYLTLDRRTSTLSSGEVQRTRLARQLGNPLSGITYVLDEPTVGLHALDTRRLVETLRELRNRGNTLVVVENDEELIRQADEIIELGEGAGSRGGKVIAQGSLEEVLGNPLSLTGSFLSGRRKIPFPSSRRTGKGKVLKISGVQTHNLKNVEVSFPLGRFIAVTGLSGSGKSSLVMDTLLPAIQERLREREKREGFRFKLQGWEEIKEAVPITPSRLGQTPSSNPATYTGAFDFIRELFAETATARMKGFLKGRFSFNRAGGRCEACKGRGIVEVPMHFLPDVWIECETCGGRRFNGETLRVEYRGKSIHQVLNMEVSEALEFFRNSPPITAKLRLLEKVGLGYIRLGQPSPTLSGGESLRVKLVAALSRFRRGHTLYLLDEPTTGLHPADIERILHVLFSLVKQGDTVVVMEHHMDVIKVADHVIDLGPGGGEEGGEVVAQGTPEQVASSQNSVTGKFLRSALDRGAQGGS